MNNFRYSIPTVIHFGKDTLPNLAEIAQTASKLLVVYGGGSVKRSGLYDKVMAILAEAGVQTVELSGVEPNPRIQSVRKGVEICKAQGVQAVLGLGGGSSIDCAKVIAAGALYDGDPWDLVVDSSKIQKALPIFSVLTLSATGSEMDPFAVISDLGLNEKWGTCSDHLVPRMSVLDPTLTYTVPRRQTAAGTADIMSHVFETYFTNVKGGFIQARFAESLLETCIKYAPIALEDPENYEARANLMWASSLAINFLIKYGVEVSWTVHPMEHELSAFYDITHGEGLAILTPHWMKAVLNDDNVDQFVSYGVNVWGVDKNLPAWDIANLAIQKTSDFFRSMGMPMTLREVGITDEKNFRAMADKTAPALKGALVELTSDQVVEIFRAAL